MSKSRPSPFGVTRTLIHFKMSEVPEPYKVQLRELALPTKEGGVFYRWTYHDGSTYCLILFEGKPEAKNIVGWSAVTLQEEPCPFVGVFVDPERRGYGYGRELVENLLDYRKPLLRKYRHIYAVSKLFPCYRELLRDRGYTHLEWE